MEIENMAWIGYLFHNIKTSKVDLGPLCIYSWGLFSFKYYERAGASVTAAVHSLAYSAV